MNIENITMDIPKGFLKSLNDFNQDIKNIFSSYYIYPSGLVISKSSNELCKLGNHFCITNYVFLDKYLNFIINLESDVVFKTIKEYKKYIKTISIKNGNIELNTDDSDFVIGRIIDSNGIEATSLKNIYSSVISISDNIVDKDPYRIQISDDDILDLTKNAYKNIVSNKYRCRITRELIPGLKKTHKMDIHFNDNIDDDRLFNMHIVVERSQLRSYHNYVCIYI